MRLEKRDFVPVVLEKVVANDLCIGCGMCVFACPENALKMAWNDLGFLVPRKDGTCNNSNDCIDVCPFNPFPEDGALNEDQLSKVFKTDEVKYHPKLGKYVGIYAGYSKDFRLTSSSGGMATYFFSKLLEENIVSCIFSVVESQDHKHYEYGIIQTQAELINSSKTRYYPVTLEQVLNELANVTGQVAIVGVACFVKAIRLAQMKRPELKIKVPFLVGIICGGIKSSFFTEYLASKVNIEKEKIGKPDYRIKDLRSTAGDYSFGCKDKMTGQAAQIKMKMVGDMWGTGLFKASPCDFCDDVTTELADVSLGDAWIEPYVRDGAGTNVIITRSKLANEIILKGMQNEEIVIDSISVDDVIYSQRGSFNHRHNGLGFRRKIAKLNGRFVPPKRFDKERISVEFAVVQLLRLFIRRMSLLLWSKNSNAAVFDAKIRKYIRLLSLVTKFYHLRHHKKKKV